MTAPTRAVNLVAASTDVEDVMAAIWADIPNGSWSQVTQTQTSNPGDKSFAIRAPGGALELNFSNDNLGAPSTTDIRVGINPDGVSDPIVNSEAPHTDAANFSGTDRGKLLSLGQFDNVEFIWMEWPDAVMALFKNAARTLTPNGIHAGKTLVQPLTSLGNPGGISQVRMDGHAILGERPGFDGTADNGFWLPINNSYPMFMRRRLGLGQTFHATNRNVAWTESGKILERYSASGSYFYYGPLAERVPSSVIYSDLSSDFWVAKYLRQVPHEFPCFTIWPSGASDRYMTVRSVADAAAPDGSCAVLIPDGFTPLP
jgi:hypothetical protein